jgi:hypothetical protein
VARLPNRVRWGAYRILAWTFNLATLQQQQLASSWSRRGGRGGIVSDVKYREWNEPRRKDGEEAARRDSKLRHQTPISKFTNKIREWRSSSQKQSILNDQITTLPPTFSNRRTPALGADLIRLKDPVKAAVDARIPRHARQP